MINPKSPEDSPGYLLWRATLSWQRRIAAALREHDLTHAQFVVLASAWWLADREEQPTQRRVADHSGTDPMTTSQVLRALEKKGMVGRVADPADTRAKRIALTDSGRAALQRAMPDVHAVDADFFGSAPRDDLISMLTNLAKPEERS